MTYLITSKLCDSLIPVGEKNKKGIYQKQKIDKNV
jgi:hypothetical protein